MFPETYVARVCFSDVSSFAIREELFSEAKYDSAALRKHFVFPHGIENMFPSFARPLELLQVVCK